jgi:hypothetical protein
MTRPSQSEVLVVGGGAAGLAAAIFSARRIPGVGVVVLDGAAKLGAKILVSGGGRCNVTNRHVAETDFQGGSRPVIRRVLRALTEVQTVQFFREIGVPLHEEEHGKLFPDSHRAQTVLDALLAEAARRGVTILPGHRVEGIEADRGSYLVTARVRASAEPSHRTFRATKVILATGGLSLPKTGSDGLGYQLARGLGHSLVPTTPGLAPLILEGDFHVPLSGVSHVVELTVRVADSKPLRIRGSMLWTHFGISGPVVLDVSRFWHRAKLENQPVQITADLLGDASMEAAEAWLLALCGARPKLQLHGALADRLPARVAEATVRRLGLRGDTTLAHLGRSDRRKLLLALREWPLPIRDSRGYHHAEVTAGGIPLDEIHPATMESRISPGLHLIGEVLDVDGRIGGFNFQWAWSSGFVAASAAVQCREAPSVR